MAPTRPRFYAAGHGRGRVRALPGTQLRRGRAHPRRPGQHRGPLGLQRAAAQGDQEATARPGPDRRGNPGPAAIHPRAALVRHEPRGGQDSWRLPVPGEPTRERRPSAVHRVSGTSLLSPATDPGDRERQERPLALTPRVQPGVVAALLAPFSRQWLGEPGVPDAIRCPPASPKGGPTDPYADPVTRFTAVRALVPITGPLGDPLPALTNDHRGIAAGCQRPASPYAVRTRD